MGGQINEPCGLATNGVAVAMNIQDNDQFGPSLEPTSETSGQIHLREGNKIRFCVVNENEHLGPIALIAVLIDGVYQPVAKFQEEGYPKLFGKHILLPEWMEVPSADQQVIQFVVQKYTAEEQTPYGGRLEFTFTINIARISRFQKTEENIAELERLVKEATSVAEQQTARAKFYAKEIGAIEDKLGALRHLQADCMRMATEKQEEAARLEEQVKHLREDLPKKRTVH